MTQNNKYRSLSLAVLVLMAAAVGAVAVTGTVGAQDAGNETAGNETTGNATDGVDDTFYNTSGDNPLNVRFRDCCGHTVDSVAEGVLNLNIVYGMADGSFDVEITASGLSESQIESITADSAEYDTNNLSRTDIVGMNFTSVPTGEYEFTVSVVGEEATETVPLEVTGEETATNGSAANETNGTATETGNETEMGAAQMGNETAGNATITAMPSTANTSANYTVSTVVGPDAAGNLSQITINYRGSNASFGIIEVFSATLGGESIINNTTAPTLGFNGQNLTIGFDGTVQVEQGDRLNVTYGGVTNPAEPGTYTVGVAVNNGTFENATLVIGQNATAGNATASNETEMGAAQIGNATGNTSVTAMPSTANTSANHTVSTVVGPNATGNLTQITVNYRESNTTFGIIEVFSASLGGESIINNTTAPTLGFNGQNLTIGFDGTVQVEQGDRLNVTYGGVTNPPEPGTYTVGVAVNNGTFENATLSITQNTTANGTQTTTATTTGAGAATTTGGGTTTGGAGTAAGTALETVTGTAAGTGTGGGGGNGGGQGTPAGGPGFGIAIAVVALLAAALLAVRRN